MVSNNPIANPTIRYDELSFDPPPPPEGIRHDSIGDVDVILYPVSVAVNTSMRWISPGDRPVTRVVFSVVSYPQVATPSI